MRDCWQIGDLVLPKEEFRGQFPELWSRYKQPFRIIGSGINMVRFEDAVGKKTPWSYYGHRFLLVETPYDPTQMGDKDDDI